VIGIERHRVQRARRRSEREEVGTCCDSFFAASLSLASWACLLVFGPISTASARFRHIFGLFSCGWVGMQAFEQHGWRPLTRPQGEAPTTPLGGARSKGTPWDFVTKCHWVTAPIPIVWAMPDDVLTAALRPLMAAFVSGFEVFCADEFETFFGRFKQLNEK
jgi:hypothetical protein